MNNPTVDMYNTINANSFDWIDEVHVGQLPIEEAPTNDNTILLIQELSNDVSGFGGDTFNKLIQELSLTIWYTTTKELPDTTTTLEVQLMKFLVSAGWQINLSQGATIDPTSGQLQKIIHVTRTQTVSI